MKDNKERYINVVAKATRKVSNSLSVIEGLDLIIKSTDSNPVAKAIGYTLAQYSPRYQEVSIISAVELDQADLPNNFKAIRA